MTGPVVAATVFRFGDRYVTRAGEQAKRERDGTFTVWWQDGTTTNHMPEFVRVLPREPAARQARDQHKPAPEAAP